MEKEKSVYQTWLLSMLVFKECISWRTHLGLLYDLKTSTHLYLKYVIVCLLIKIHLISDSFCSWKDRSQAIYVLICSRIATVVQEPKRLPETLLVLWHAGNSHCTIVVAVPPLQCFSTSKRNSYGGVFVNYPRPRYGVVLLPTDFAASSGHCLRASDLAPRKGTLKV